MTKYPEQKRARRTPSILRATNGIEVKVTIVKVSIEGWWGGGEFYPRRFWTLVR